MINVLHHYEIVLLLICFLFIIKDIVYIGCTKYAEVTGQI